MTRGAIKENSMTLQALLGVAESVTQKILKSAVLISVSGNHPRLKEFLSLILSRTFESVHESPNPNTIYACEIITDKEHRLTDSPFVSIGNIDATTAVVSRNTIFPRLSDNQHAFIYYLIACYSGAQVLKTICPQIEVTCHDQIVIDIDRLAPNKNVFTKTVNIQKAYLAGAGAIGNTFLLALSAFDVIGELNVTDPDVVSDGNLNRCVFFLPEDIDKKKVAVLVQKAQQLFKHLKLVPFDDELSKHPDKNEDGTWLKKLIVGVDSRRARRSLQSEIPKEVFDASTTGIAEIVVHYNQIPWNGKACLGCIYTREKQEEAHELHLAETLGVSLGEVRQQFIDKGAAEKIAKKFSVDAAPLLGQAYDTLFKQLCGEGKLMKAETQRILAPLAFVSALAGGFLALMLIEKHLSASEYNYWRVSPWANPNFKLQQIRPINPNCEYCNDATFNAVATKIWENLPVYNA